MHKGKKTSNLSATDALATLLKNGFETVAGQSDTRPTARRDARQSKSFAGTQDAVTSKSGKSIFLIGNHAETQQRVQIHLQSKGMLTIPARDALRKQTGLDL